MAVYLVTGSGTTYESQGARPANYPSVYLGGRVTTIANAACTGDISYYGLDNSTLDVYKMRCYDDITITPNYVDFEEYCDGVLHNRRQLQSYTFTLNVTQDILDLKMLQLFMDQPAADYDSDLGCHIETLMIGERCFDEVPVLLEHHYQDCDSSETEYFGVLAFAANISLGDVSIDPNEGYSGELTFAISYDTDYEAYLSLMRKDSVVLV